MQRAVWPYVKDLIEMSVSKSMAIEQIIEKVHEQNPMLTRSHAKRLVMSLETRNYIRKNGKGYVLSDGRIVEKDD